MMTEDQNTKCHAIIHTAAAAAGAVGASPIPGSDCLPIMAIQTAMIVSLGEVFDIKLSKSYAESIAETAVAGQAGKYFCGQLLKLIPGVGWVANASVAAAITETLGWDMATDFAERSEKSA